MSVALKGKRGHEWPAHGAQAMNAQRPFMAPVAAPAFSRLGSPFARAEVRGGVLYCVE